MVARDGEAPNWCRSGRRPEMLSKRVPVARVCFAHVRVRPEDRLDRRPDRPASPGCVRSVRRSRRATRRPHRLVQRRPSSRPSSGDSHPAGTRRVGHRIARRRRLRFGRLTLAGFSVPWQAFLGTPIHKPFERATRAHRSGLDPLHPEPRRIRPSPVDDLRARVAAPTRGPNLRSPSARLRSRGRHLSARARSLRQAGLHAMSARSVLVCLLEGRGPHAISVHRQDPAVRRGPLRVVSTEGENGSGGP